MRYRIKMMSNDELYITESEYQKIIASHLDGLVFIESLKATINMRSVETILPENLVPKKELKKGRLHDGTKVVKQFGVWKDTYNPNVLLDPQYYPEIVTDNVMSENEYASYQKTIKIMHVKKPKSVKKIHTHVTNTI